MIHKLLGLVLIVPYLALFGFMLYLKAKEGGYLVMITLTTIAIVVCGCLMGGLYLLFK